MQLYFVGLVLFSGLVLAGRHDHLEYAAVSDGSHLAGIEYEGHEPECDLRQVVSSLKDLKGVLCKLITVQKKQLELEVERSKSWRGNPTNEVVSSPATNSSSSSSAPETADVVIGRVGNALSSVNEPHGASVDVVFTTTTPATAAPASATTEQPRDKRHSKITSSSSSDFAEIAVSDLEALFKKGFAFPDDDETELKFLGEHPTGDIGDVTAFVEPPTTDRKARKADTEEATKVTETKAKVEKAKRPEKVLPEESEEEEKSRTETQEESEEAAPVKASVRPAAPDHLTVSYDRMEKKKAMPKLSLPRQKSLEFPNGGTYYSNGGGASSSKPVDYTLNIPQQTYYYVPGPVPGQNRLVAAPSGVYDPEMSQYPSKSLEAQYAPSSMTMDQGYHGGEMSMGHGDYEAQGQGGQVRYLNEEEEEDQTPPPKEKKKRRKARKEKKVHATEDEATTTGLPPTEE